LLVKTYSPQWSHSAAPTGKNGTFFAGNRYFFVPALRPVSFHTLQQRHYPASSRRRLVGDAPNEARVQHARNLARNANPILRRTLPVDADELQRAAECQIDAQAAERRMLALFELGDAVIIEAGRPSPHGDIAMPDRKFMHGIAAF